MGGLEKDQPVPCRPSLVLRSPMLWREWERSEVGQKLAQPNANLAKSRLGKAA